MKKKAIIILAFLLLFPTLSSCKKTPDKPVVVAKDNKQIKIEQSIESSAEQLGVSFSDGDHIEQIIKHDQLPISIEIDAALEVPDTDNFFTVAVHPYRFSQENADVIIDYIVGNHYYASIDLQENSIVSKEKEDIELLQYKIEKMKREEPQETELILRLDTLLEESKKNLILAKKLDDFPLVSRQFVSGDYDNEVEKISGSFEKNGQLFSLSISNDESGKHSVARLYQYGKNEGIYSDYEFVIVPQNEEIVGLEYQKSLQISEDVVLGIGAKKLGLELSYSEGVDFKDNDKYDYYRFYYTKTINDLSCGYDETQEISADTIFENEEKISENLEFAEPWKNESLIICIDANGLQSFEWQSPCITAEQVSQNVKLLSIKEIVSSFSQMAFLKHSYISDELNWDEVNEICIYINKIRLSLMRIQIGDDYYLRPVWDFYGQKKYYDSNGNIWTNGFSEEDQKHIDYVKGKSAFLTIDAVDGSIIDRQFGY